jgi:hypothetical protein
MDEEERKTRDELTIIDALVQAINRRDEVLQLIEDCLACGRVQCDGAGAGIST